MFHLVQKTVAYPTWLSPPPQYGMRITQPSKAGSMPCAVAQGMARGLRVITTDASGSRLTLETGQSSSSAQLKEDTMLTSGSRATLLAMA